MFTAGVYVVRLSVRLYCARARPFALRFSRRLLRTNFSIIGEPDAANVARSLITRPNRDCCALRRRRRKTVQTRIRVRPSRGFRSPSRSRSDSATRVPRALLMRTDHGRRHRVFLASRGCSARSDSQTTLTANKIYGTGRAAAFPRVNRKVENRDFARFDRHPFVRIYNVNRTRFPFHGVTSNRNSNYIRNTPTHGRHVCICIL